MIDDGYNKVCWLFDDDYGLVDGLFNIVLIEEIVY